MEELFIQISTIEKETQALSCEQDDQDPAGDDLHIPEVVQNHKQGERDVIKEKER